jgi:hypothetical protein
MNNKRVSQEQLVWYVSFGSNMNPERFSCYILGGTPNGGLHSQRGCDNKRMPRAEHPIDLPYTLYFAGESKIWTGGVCFLDTITPGATKGKAMLVTLEQFEQITAQESQREHALPIDVNLMRQKGYTILGDGSHRYDKLVYCGEHEGYPVLVFTSPRKIMPYNKPSDAYLRTVTLGLSISRKMTAEDIVLYLIDKPGVAGNYTSSELRSILLEPVTEPIGQLVAA